MRRSLRALRAAGARRGVAGESTWSDIARASGELLTPPSPPESGYIIFLLVYSMQTYPWTHEGVRRQVCLTPDSF